MGNASYYEDIVERFFESEPLHSFYGFSEISEPINDYLADSEMARKFGAFIRRIQAIALTQAPPEENSEKILRLRRFNKQWSDELSALRD